MAIQYGRAKEAALDEFGLTERTLDPDFAPLTWRTAASVTADAASPGSDAITLSLAPEMPVLVLERVTGLPPAAYMFAQTVGGSEAGKGLQLRWRILCPQSLLKTPLWQQPVPVPRGRIRYQSRIEVPVNCPLQTWQLTAYLEGQQSEATFRIEALELKRLAR